MCVLEYSNVAEHLILKLRPLKVHSKDHSVSDFLPPQSVDILYSIVLSATHERISYMYIYIG